MLKKTITALSLLCILAACQSDDNSSPQPKPRKDIALTRAEQEMMDLGTDFAFRFFNQVCKTEVEKPNLFISPLSASLCLSMIANGALGNTLSEMTDVLGFSGYSLEEMNNYNKKLVEALLDLDNTTQLGIANSIWIKKGFGVHDDFVSVNKKMYDAQVQELDFALPRWVTMLEPGHWLQAQVYAAAMQLAERVSRMKDLPAGTDAPALECDAVQRSAVAGADLAAGSVRVSVELKPEIFYQVLSEQTGLDIGDEAGLMPCIMELARAKRAYEKVRSALEQVEATGYGIVMPSIDELHLEPPEIVHQDGRCGVRLQACAPSIQMMKATIHTELSPIVGTEKQSEDLVQSLLADFADDPVQLWESNIFGKSLHELVNDGLQNKLLHIPQEARTRLQETLERVINEGCTGLICILI